MVERSNGVIMKILTKKTQQRNEEVNELKRRIYELEELICPFNQHEYVKIDYRTNINSYNSNFEAYTIRRLQCVNCKKIIEDSNKNGSFKYKVMQE